MKVDQTLYVYKCVLIYYFVMCILQTLRKLIVFKVVSLLYSCAYLPCDVWCWFMGHLCHLIGGQPWPSG